MTTTQQIWTLTVNFQDREDAVALRDLLEEMGLEAALTSHYAGPVKINPVSEQRLGAIMLEEMAKRPGCTFTTEDLMVICVDNRYAANSWASTISKLVGEGKVEKVTRGLYRLPRHHPTVVASHDAA